MDISSKNDSIVKSQKSITKNKSPVVARNKSVNVSVVASMKKPTTEDDTKVYYCVLCDEKFIEHHLLIDHFRKHGEKKQIRIQSPSGPLTSDKESNFSELIECEWCSEVFETISKAIEHKLRKHRYESTNYFCKDCGKLFPLKIALEQHIYVDYKQPVPRNDNIKCLFLCKFCNVSFSTVEAVRFHENGAHQMQKRLQNVIVLPPASKKVKVNNQRMLYMSFV